jgi:glycosyltransferase involved in cell wall biosynthesis
LTWIYDVAVLPSETESFPFVILEAMACRRPVIATNVGGIPDIVDDGNTGILVPPKDSDKLAEAIIKLLKDKELRERMGDAGRERFERLFTQERMLGKTFSLYEESLLSAGVLRGNK